MVTPQIEITYEEALCDATDQQLEPTGMDAPSLSNTQLGRQNRMDRDIFRVDQDALIIKFSNRQ